MNDISDLDIMNGIYRVASWEEWSWDQSWSSTTKTLNAWYNLPDNLGQVRLVIRKRSSWTDDYSHQGQIDEDVYLIFEYKHPVTSATRFFRKDGQGDSYGDSTFQGQFYEVKAKPVSAIDYVRVGR